MNILAIFEVIFFLLPLIAPVAVAAPTHPTDPAVVHAQLVSPVAVVPLARITPAPLRKIQRTDIRDLGVLVTAKSAMVLDRDSGAILYQKNPVDIHAIASLTKLMTAMVAARAPVSWDASVTMLAEDHREGSVEYFYPGDVVTRRDLLFAALVGSSNTAAVALARSSASSSDVFVQTMNRTARSLGLTDATFADPTGLDDDNRGTVLDVVKLAQAAFLIPEISKAASTEIFSLTPKQTVGTATRTIRSTDQLLSSTLDQGRYAIIAAKTGTLGEATGYHLTLAVRDTKEQREVLVAVLGSADNPARFSDAKALVYWAFGAYRWEPHP